VAAYCVASSLMLVLNKGALTLIPEPGLLLVFQLGATVVLALGLHMSGRVTLNLRPRREVTVAYFTVSVVFLITLFGNMKILEHAGVNAFIIVRSLTPFAVCLLDFLFMGRSLPHMRSALSLVFTALFCSLYILTKTGDPSGGGSSADEFGSTAVFWCLFWFMLFVFDQVFIKAVVDKYPASGWERTLYQNIFAFAVAVVGVVSKPPTTLLVADASSSLRAWGVVMASCAVGATLSYAGLSLRGDVTATMFTVLGVSCKMISILLNEVFLQPTNNVLRMAFIILAVVSSAMYQQAPKRRATKAADGSSKV